jgi:hypothetical protein
VFIWPYARQRTERVRGDGHTSFVQDDQSLSLRRITTRAAKLGSAAGIAALMAWMPLLLGASRSTLPVSQIEDAKPEAAIDAGTEPLKGIARYDARCAECGLIESIRKTEGDFGSVAPLAASGPADGNRHRAPAGFTAREITVRLQDGSSRVMIDANPGRLRLGERVKVIDGLAGPGE